MYQVVKRDGALVDFDISKISAAVQKAFEALDKNYNQNNWTIYQFYETRP